MLSKIKYLALFGVILLLTGCTLFNQAVPTIQPPTAIPVTLATNTAIPMVIYVTATPFGPSGDTTPVAAYSSPTAAPANASISIDSIDDNGGGKAVVHWTPIGDFPAGYILVWSSTDQQPTYPADQFNYAGDPASRSALITADIGKIYYLRVCRFVNNTCDVYSNLGIFALLKSATATPVHTAVSSGGGTAAAGTKTATPVGSAYNSAGTPISSSSSIKITSIVDAGSGKSKITWTATGTFTSGFRILYSTSYANPYYGGYPYYVITDGTSRVAYLDGAPGSTVYYRICRITGTTCDIYSNSYSFKYPGTAFTSTPTSTTPSATPTITPTPTMTLVPTATFTPTNTFTVTPSPTPDGSTISITSVADTGSGAATINWSASGDFPYGFIILMSKTVALPTISDTTIPASGVQRSSPISGDAGSTYHIRICKLYGSACTIYSSVVDFTFGKIQLDGFEDVSDGNATVSWLPSGVFSDGFKIVSSDTNASPTLADSVVTVSGSGATDGTFTGTPGTLYHVRVCKYDGVSACILYSDTQDFTFAKIAITGLTQSTETNAHLVWTADGLYPNGFLWLVSLINPTPSYGDADTQYGAIGGGSATRTADFTIVPGIKYYFRVCQADSLGHCVIYSDVQSLTFTSSLVLTATAVGSNMQLDWTGPTGYSNFTHYKIYGALDSDPPAVITTLAKTNFTFTYTPAGSGTYDYLVCAWDSAIAKCVGYSNSPSATIP